MAIDEFRAVLKAREFVRKVNPATVPVTVEMYAREAGAVIRPQTDLGPDEAGYCFQNDGKYFICTNANDREERQRFTVCHEIAHIVLRLPSQHSASPWWSYRKGHLPKYSVIFLRQNCFFRTTSFSRKPRSRASVSRRSTILRSAFRHP